ncbi:MAG: DUF4404 family protein [Pirellulales bacterium]|nr:DUF4404 family protein [Pirellulales bacterium]
MNEERNALLGTLDDLHEELETAQDVSPEVEEKLREAMDDIRKVLDAKEPDTTETSPGVTGGLSDAARDFESSHPTISSMLGSVIDALGRMGI